MPPPQFVTSHDGLTLATYTWGREGDPPVLLVHGFASSAEANFAATGWTRDLVRAGFSVVALDQRGHGRSEKPLDPAAYSVELMVADVLAVLDAHLHWEAAYVGYSLGARVGWQAVIDLPDRIPRAVLGGVPDGEPLTRFRTEQARAHVETQEPVADPITAAYLRMAASIGSNDLAALVAVVEGLRGGTQPDPAAPPTQPVLFATGSEDGILERSRRLAAATPTGEFFEIPGRHHFNAPTSRHFRDAAISFLREG